MKLSKITITVVGVSDQVDEAIKEKLEDYDVNIVNEVPPHYLSVAKELEAQSILAVAMSELYQENQFLIGQWNYLAQIKAQLTASLIKQPMDVRFTVDLKKVSNDLDIIIKASTLVNQTIFKHIENKFGGGNKFQYCKTNG